MISSDWFHDLDLSGIEVVGLGDSCAIVGNSTKCEMLEIFESRKALPLKFIKTVSCGVSHALILTNDGLLYTIGSNRACQLGIGVECTESSECNLIMDNVELISAGRTCGLVKTFSGDLFGFGSNQAGILGLPGPEKVPRPTLIRKDENGISCISAGYGHSAYVSGGVLYATGSNSHGQIDFLTSELYHNGFARVSFPQSIASVGCGIWNTLIVSHEGDLFACGRAPPFQTGPIRIVDLLERDKIPRKEERFPPWTEIFTGFKLLDVRVGSSLALARSFDKKTVAVIDLIELRCKDVVNRSSEIRDYSVSGSSWLIV